MLWIKLKLLLYSLQSKQHIQQPQLHRQFSRLSGKRSCKPVSKNGQQRPKAFIMRGTNQLRRFL